MQSELAEDVRENNGLLAVPEKRALLWLAERTPAWINSDHLTLLGLVAMLAAGAGYWMARWNRFTLLLVVVSLAVNWLGDSLDGTLARFRGCQRPRYGYYVDHVIDLVGTSALLGGLALSGYMSQMVAVVLLAVFAIVEAQVFLATHVQHVFRLSCFRFGPTELRVVLAIGTLYLLYNPRIYLGNYGPFLLFDIGGIAATTALLLAFVYSAVQNTRALYRAEPLISRQRRGENVCGIQDLHRPF